MYAPACTHRAGYNGEEGLVTSAPIHVEELLEERGAYYATVQDRAFLRITGTDATRWLNGMVTNSIQSLKPGEGNYNFLLNAQGRIQGDCTIYREAGDTARFLLGTSIDQIVSIQTLLDRFIIMDDVELSRSFEQEESLVFTGRDAPLLLSKLGLPELGPMRMVQASTAEGDVLLLAGSARQFPAFELRASADVIGKFVEKAAANGARPITTEDREALRIISGEPRFGVDIRDRDLPQETNQPHALHFAKGCYLGQEIVERIRSRGQVHRVFTPFLLQGTLPELPTQLEVAGKPAGEITSAVQVGGQIFALGYARREALDNKRLLTYSGGSATVRTIQEPTRIQQHENAHG